MEKQIFIDEIKKRCDGKKHNKILMSHEEYLKLIETLKGNVKNYAANHKYQLVSVANLEYIILKEVRSVTVSSQL